jgi:hypothetical protein
MVCSGYQANISSGQYQIWVMAFGNVQQLEIQRRYRLKEYRFGSLIGRMVCFRRGGGPLRAGIGDLINRSGYRR